MKTHTIKKQLSAAYRYSYSRLALNSYTICEIMEETQNIPDDFQKYTARFRQLLKDYLDGTVQVESLELLREAIIANMEVIAAYTDCFMIYRYVLSRMERRFYPTKSDAESVDALLARLLTYLKDSQSPVVFNGKVSQIVSLLPVRYTRQKFFSLLQDGLSVYVDSDKSSLERMLYMLRMESMLQLPEKMAEDYPELFEILQQLKTEDYMHMNQEQYLAVRDKVDLAQDRLSEEENLYILLLEVVNDLYVLYLAESESMMALDEKQLLQKTLRFVLDGFQSGHISLQEQEITQLLHQLEGIQESAIEQFYAHQVSLSEDESPTARNMRQIEKLLSGSLFVSLDETDNIEEVADRNWVEQQIKQFQEELSLVFDCYSKPVVRSIMSKLLSDIPMSFSSAEELKEYIANSLNSCSDMDEREISMELLSQMMEMDDVLV